MVTVLRSGGFRVVVYLNDHPPAHVHVIGAGEAKIDLEGDAPRLIWARGMTRPEVREAVGIVTAQHAFLRRRWSELHERTDR